MGWNGSGGSKPVQKVVRKRPLTGIFVILAIGLAVIALAVVFLALPSSNASHVKRDGRAELTHSRGSNSRSPKDAVRKAMPKKLPKVIRHKRPERPVELFEHLNGVDRKMAEAVQSALDADDFEKVVLAATESLSSDNPEVRQNAVEALGWFGAQALPELTGAMTDADEDVRQAAENCFEQAVQEIEEPADRFKVTMAAFGALTDPDQLATLGGLVGNDATEFIDGEDDPAKAAENRLSVLQAIVEVIEGNQPQNAEAAKELYNDITGNEWLGLDEAQRYLDDPENYEPPEAS